MGAQADRAAVAAYERRREWMRKRPHGHRLGPRAGRSGEAEHGEGGRERGDALFSAFPPTLLIRRALTDARTVAQQKR